MYMHEPKTLRDFPQYKVAAVRRGKTSSEGYTHFELEGKFDGTIENIDPHWFWLLIGEKDCLCATLVSLDKDTGAAILTCDLVNEPRVVGQNLAYLSPRWQAYYVWMVLDPTWGWEKKRFQGADATAEDYVASDTSIVEGREVKVWTKLELMGGREGGSRYYPASDQTLSPSSEKRIVSGGWDHEHCDLCKSHIDAGELGYCDPGGRWMCENCYERFVLRHDLSFVDGL
jgi:hypothetical protein